MLKTGDQLHLSGVLVQKIRSLNISVYGKPNVNILVLQISFIFCLNSINKKLKISESLTVFNFKISRSLNDAIFYVEIAILKTGYYLYYSGVLVQKTRLLNISVYGKPNLNILVTQISFIFCLSSINKKLKRLRNKQFDNFLFQNVTKFEQYSPSMLKQLLKAGYQLHGCVALVQKSRLKISVYGKSNLNILIFQISLIFFKITIQ